jgi:predicted AlkP superfamily pyrophosphatase or phosphodiesterase
MAPAFWLRLPLSALLLAALLPARPLLVVSIDGMDHRYLRDADKLGLKIPNLRRIVAQGAWADKGVIGVVPTVTFPSHTSMMTGARPDQHGILNNNRPKPEGGERYFFESFIKVPTLWGAAKKAGLKVGGVHWPVTVDSKSFDWDFPEHFKRRQGAGMDWDATAGKATPGLIDKMIARFPSMPQEWIDDRVRTLATVYMLKYEKPDLVLLHLIDHDSEAHETGPFSIHAKAVLERTDELLGDILAAKPKNMAVAIVSDHGFERVDQHVAVPPQATSYGTFATANDAATAEQLARVGGRRISADEWKRFQPHLPVPLAAFESKPHTQFVREGGKPGPLPKPHGDHGFWPMRDDFRSSFVVWTPGGRPSRLGEIDMLTIAGRLAAVLEIPFGKDSK